jgi:branched-chain amino acid transport system substrate-binding protein
VRPPQVRFVTALAVLAAIALVGGCTSDDSGGGRKQLDLRIGGIVPRTGPLQQFGDPGQQAADQAVDEIRKAAAKAGARHKVTISYGDDESIPNLAVNAAKKLQAAGADCFVGPWGGGAAERVMSLVAAPKKVLEISPAASGDAISKAQDRGYLNRVVPPDRMQAGALAELLDRELRGGARGKKVNVGALESTYSDELIKSFDDAWSGKGGRIGTKQTYRQDQPTFEEQSQALASGNPDAWVFFDFMDTYGRLANDLLADKQAKFSPKKTFGTDSLANPRVANLGLASNGLRGVAISAPREGPAAEEFNRRYTARGDAPRQTFDAQAFDATVLCYLSAVAAGSTSGEKMKDKLREVSAPPGRKFNWMQLDQAIKALEAGQDIDYDGASGPIDLNDVGDATAGVYDVYEFKDGKLEFSADQIAIPQRAGGI